MASDPVETAAVEREIRRIGEQLADAFPAGARHPITALDRRAMSFAAEDRALRAALFRFVDVAPACRSLDDLARHLAGFVDELDPAPRSLHAATRVAGLRAGRSALGLAAAAGIRHMAHRFIVSESVPAALPALRRLWIRGVASSVDLLGEAAVTHAEADAYATRCEEAMGVLSRAVVRWPVRPLLDSDSCGALPRANLSVKVTALTPLLRPEAPELAVRDAGRRLERLLRVALREGVHLHVDMESADTREAILALVLELLGREEFAQGPSAGIVIQAYLRDSPAQVERVLDWAERCARRPPLVVRLVKGAYWDHEIVQARQHGWKAPVFELKGDCDRNFEVLTRRLLEARPLVRVAVGSHNLRSVAHAIAWSRALDGSERDLELQVLRGLGEDLQHALAASGLRVRSYCPVGDLVGGMAYLIRRLLENTSNESFLGQRAEGDSVDTLLVAP